jgi:FkbM family methyltransferase
VKIVAIGKEFKEFKEYIDIMYRINKGLREWSLEPNVFNHIFNTKCKEFNVNQNKVKFYSQQDEDKYIIQYILKQKITDGTYLEIGGCDGVLYSNTKTLEDHFGFSGIIIEPQQHYFQKLQQNRPNNKCYNCAVSNSSEEYIEFIGNNPEGGVVETINTNISKFNWTNTYSVPNKKMSDIIANSGLSYIDIMSIDVEGGEYDLLQSIDFTFPIYLLYEIKV